MPLRYDPALIAGLVVPLDLAGTFVFALSGAMAGIKHRLDLFGVLVLSFAAGSAGGLIRDVLLGATPPPAISDWRYIGVSLAAGLVTFLWFPFIDRLRSSVLVLDAAGSRCSPCRARSRRWPPGSIRSRRCCSVS